MNERDPAPGREALPHGLPLLPVFFVLRDRRVVLAGASARAVWKAELLAAAGAAVAVVAAAPSEGMRALAARGPGVTLVPRDWQPADLADAALAIGDMDTDVEAARFRAAAQAAGVPVNLIDRPAFCDFQFGAIVERGALVIGISTQGSAPVLAQALRTRIEALLPQALRGWLAAAKTIRARLDPHMPFAARRAFWERFSRAALAASHPPDAAQLAALEGAVGASVAGRVTLVGAGPGDPELVTLKAVRALQNADVVLFDDLVAPEVVALARREAEKIAVGKRGYRPSCRQSDITATLIRLAGAGKRVVRLKGGDPMIFGRANEEIAALRAAGVAVDVVPGVTAALGAAASLQTSLTERDIGRRVQFITAHARDGQLPQDIAWPALCDPGAATIVYMGVKTMPELAARLLAEGIDPTTPAVLVERATWPDERHIAGTIADLPPKVAAAAPTGPCLLMIGRVFGEGAVAQVRQIETASSLIHGPFTA